ncbi:MAG: hypothetical protein IPJ88_04995 [Myxococcales bacterium]|nr:MAG: hypothetical protein IPJ88_04995 [Myxococcales bacterium]
MLGGNSFVPGNLAISKFRSTQAGCVPALLFFVAGVVLALSACTASEFDLLDHDHTAQTDDASPWQGIITTTTREASVYQLHLDSWQLQPIDIYPQGKSVQLLGQSGLDASGISDDWAQLWDADANEFRFIALDALATTVDTSSSVATSAFTQMNCNIYTLSAQGGRHRIGTVEAGTQVAIFHRDKNYVQISQWLHWVPLSCLEGEAVEDYATFEPVGVAGNAAISFTVYGNSLEESNLFFLDPHAEKVIAFDLDISATGKRTAQRYELDIPKELRGLPIVGASGEADDLMGKVLHSNLFFQKDEHTIVGVDYRYSICASLVECINAPKQVEFSIPENLVGLYVVGASGAANDIQAKFERSNLFFLKDDHTVIGVDYSSQCKWIVAGCESTQTQLEFEIPERLQGLDVIGASGESDNPPIKFEESNLFIFSDNQITVLDYACSISSGCNEPPTAYDISFPKLTQ